MSAPENIESEVDRGTRMAEAYPDVLALVAEAITGGAQVGMFTPEQVRALLLEGARERRAGVNETDQRR